MKRWLVNLIALWVMEWVMPSIWIQDFSTLVILALVFSIIQALLKPILQLLALPITIITLGLAYWVVNAFLLYLSFMIVPVNLTGNFGDLMLASLVISVVNGFFELH